MARSKTPLITNHSDLLAYEQAVDIALCGVALGAERETRFADQGAHDLAPTHYFILEELFSHLSLTEDSHLLDVGCGVGRVLAFFLREGFPGRATGVELDPELASFTAAWAGRHPNLEVIQGSALDLDLSVYSDFYLFNPFAPNVLQQFIETLECQRSTPCTLIHMSDNGDTWHYVGRPGWTQLHTGTIQTLRNARGYQVRVYEDPQHYSIWRFDPSL